MKIKQADILKYATKDEKKILAETEKFGWHQNFAPNSYSRDTNINPELLQITIDLNNAAFEDENKEIEIARILSNLSVQIENGSLLSRGKTDKFNLKDINGNTVGVAKWNLNKQ